MTFRERLTPKEIKSPPWCGKVSPIARLAKLGVWSHLELAMYVAGRGRKNWPGAESTPLPEAVGRDQS